MIEGEPLTAWLILKAPLIVALIYLYQVVKGNQQAILITVFFFPYVFLLVRNLWLEIVFYELLHRLKNEPAPETATVKKLFTYTRIGIAVMAVGFVFLFPAALENYGKRNQEEILLIIILSLFLIFTVSAFLFQLRFRFEIGKLIYQLSTKKKVDLKHALDNKYRLHLLNPVAFIKSHKQINSLLKKV